MMRPTHKRKRKPRSHSNSNASFSRVKKKPINASPYVKLSSSSYRKYNRKRTTPKNGMRLKPIVGGYQPQTITRPHIPKFGVENGIMFETNVSQDGSEFKVVSAILKREEELKSIESITANTYTRPFWICDLAEAFVRMKHYSLDIIEAIQLWRKPQTAPNSFFWEAENYLIKMFTDMVFLRSSRRVLILFPFMLHANPLFQFDRNFLERVSEWSPAVQILLMDNDQIPLARILNAEQVLEDELNRLCMKVTNTGHLEKITLHGNNNTNEPAAMKKHKDDTFECPMPGAHLFLAHRRHMLTTGSMKAAIQLSDEVKALEQVVEKENDHIKQIEEKIFSLEKSLMFAAKEGLTMSISDVTEGNNSSLLEQSIASAALQDFLGGRRLREKKEKLKKLTARVERLKCELTIRVADAKDQRNRWNIKQKEAKAKKKRAKERRIKELEAMGIRMSQGKAHPSLDEKISLAKQKANFDALSLSMETRKSPSQQPRVTFDLDDNKQNSEKKQGKQKNDDAGENSDTNVSSLTKADDKEKEKEKYEEILSDSSIDTSKLKNSEGIKNCISDNILETKDGNVNETPTSPKEKDIQRAKDIENVFLTAPNPMAASDLAKSPSKNVFQKPKNQNNNNPAFLKNNSSLLAPIPNKSGSQKKSTDHHLDLTEVDVHLFEDDIWKSITLFLNPVEREKLRLTNKDINEYVENAVGKTFLVDDSISYLQSRIDVKSVEARTSLDSIREISRDVQNLYVPLALSLHIYYNSFTHKLIYIYSRTVILTRYPSVHLLIFIGKIKILNYFMPKQQSMIVLQKISSTCYFFLE